MAVKICDQSATPPGLAWAIAGSCPAVSKIGPMKNEELPFAPSISRTTSQRLFIIRKRMRRSWRVGCARGWSRGPSSGWVLPRLLAAVLGIWLLTTLYANREPAHAKTWKELILAEDTAKRAELGKASTGPVASWALIQAAETRYLEGFQDLPQNRDSALEKMKAAYDLFLQAREKSAAGTHERYYASMGLARTLEARGEVDDAIKQYEELATAWAESPLGEEAKRYAERLKKPRSREYYKEFAVFQPTPATLPPGGSLDLGFPLPGLPGGSTTLPGNAIPGLGDRPALIPPASTRHGPGYGPGATPHPPPPRLQRAHCRRLLSPKQCASPAVAPVVIPEPAPASEATAP